MGLKIGSFRIHYDPVTGESGPQISLLNKTDGATTKGYLVRFSATSALSFDYCAVDEPDIIGVIYEAGIADGSACWVWLENALAQVYFVGSVTLAEFARNRLTADGVGSTGQAISEAAPTAPFATDKHWLEIGHVAQATGGAGLCLTLLHFN